jgi:hypothetical protein
MILVGQSPYNEIAPADLADLCRLVGFKNIDWTEEIETYPNTDVLDFFQKRLDSLLKEIPDENIRIVFAEMATKLRIKAIQFGGMEIPYYRLVAQKEGDG